MPTTANLENPPLHLVNLAAAQVDWPRTERYAESARAAKYYARNAEADYAALTGQVATALSGRRRHHGSAQRAWPSSKRREEHWPTGRGPTTTIEKSKSSRCSACSTRSSPSCGRRRQQPVRSRVRGADRDAGPARTAPAAADAERYGRAGARGRAPCGIVGGAAVAPVGRARRHRTRRGSAAERLARRDPPCRQHHRGEELETDRQYQLLTARILQLAAARANAADVRGVERLRGDVEASDRALGRKRPDAVSGLLAALEEQLNAARTMRLAHDRWALRQPDFRNYGNQMTAPLAASSG